MPICRAEVDDCVRLGAGYSHCCDANWEGEEGNHLDGLLAPQRCVHVHATEVLVQVIDALEESIVIRW